MTYIRKGFHAGDLNGALDGLTDLARCRTNKTGKDHPNVAYTDLDGKRRVGLAIDQEYYLPDAVPYQGTMTCYTRETILAYMGKNMPNHLNAPRLFRELKKAGILHGPLRTTRKQPDGSVRNLELYAVTYRLLAPLADELNQELTIPAYELPAVPDRDSEGLMA